MLTKAICSETSCRVTPLSALKQVSSPHGLGHYLLSACISSQEWLALRVDVTNIFPGLWKGSVSIYRAFSIFQCHAQSLIGDDQDDLVSRFYTTIPHFLGENRGTEKSHSFLKVTTGLGLKLRSFPAESVTLITPLHSLLIRHDLLPARWWVGC